jgi:hypothetical protein
VGWVTLLLVVNFLCILQASKILLKLDLTYTIRTHSYLSSLCAPSVTRTVVYELCSCRVPVCSLVSILCLLSRLGSSPYVSCFLIKLFSTYDLTEIECNHHVWLASSYSGLASHMFPARCFFSAAGSLNWCFLDVFGNHHIGFWKTVHID